MVLAPCYPAGGLLASLLLMGGLGQCSWEPSSLTSAWTQPRGCWKRLCNLEMKTALFFTWLEKRRPARISHSCLLGGTRARNAVTYTVCFQWLPVHCSHCSDWATEAREGRHVPKVAQQGQQSLPLGIPQCLSALTRCQTTLQAWSALGFLRWWWLFFFLRFPKQHSSHFSDHIV